jgi:hypothetical protein
MEQHVPFPVLLLGQLSSFGPLCMYPIIVCFNGRIADFAARWKKQAPNVPNIGVAPSR